MEITRSNTTPSRAPVAKSGYPDYRDLPARQLTGATLSKFQIGTFLPEFAYKGVVLSANLKVDKSGMLFRLASNLQDHFLRGGILAGRSQDVARQLEMTSMTVYVANSKDSDESLEDRVAKFIKTQEYVHDPVSIDVQRDMHAVLEAFAKTSLDSVFRGIKGAKIHVTIDGKPVIVEPDLAFSVRLKENRYDVLVEVDVSARGVPRPIKDLAGIVGKECLATSLANEEKRVIVASVLPMTAKTCTIDLNGVQESLVDVWKKRGVTIAENEVVCQVLYKNSDKVYAYPASRIKESEKYFIPYTARVHLIKHVLYLLAQESARKAFPGLVFHDPIPEPLELIDLVKLGKDQGRPLIMTFGTCLNGKLLRDQFHVPIERGSSPEMLNQVPVNLLGRERPEGKIRATVCPIAGPMPFKLIMIAPTNNTTMEFTPRAAFDLLKEKMRSKCLASEFGDDVLIPYTWPALASIDRSAWTRMYRQEILPRLKAIDVGHFLPIIVFVTRKIGKLSKIFKDHVENDIYQSVRDEEIDARLRIIQGLNTSAAALEYRAEKDAILSYYNALYNLQFVDNDIKAAVAGGIVYKLTTPIGKANSDPADVHDLFAGYDASGDQYSDTNEKATGAILVIMDEFGKKFTSQFFPYENSLAGGFDVSLIKKMLQLLLSAIDKKEHKWVLHVIIDGRFIPKHRANFRNAINAYLPSIDLDLEVIVIWCKKRVPLRSLLPGNIPFGHMIITGRTEFVLVNHQLLPRKDKPMLSKALHLYEVRDHFSVNHGSIVQGSGFRKTDLVPIGLKLFYSSLLNVSYNGMPTKSCRMIHGAHKLSKDYHTKPAMRGIIKEKI
nr:hypothetical protein [Candidatus Sigynarchaeum springense]